MAVRPRIRTTSLALAGLTAAFAASLSLAEPATTTVGSNTMVEGTSTNDFIDDRWALSLGTYVVGSNLKADFNGNAVNSGEPIDLSSKFDMNKDYQRVRLDALWRITPKHHVQFVYFKNDVSRTRTLDKDLAWNDYTFQANAVATAESKLAVYELSYEYAFVHRPDLEVAAGAGIHMLNMSIKLSGNATFTDSNGVVHPAEFTSKNSNVPAPLPVLGARATWAVTPTILIEPQIQWLKIHYDAYDGNWWDMRVAAKWMFARHWGVGLGYDYFHVRVDVDKSSFNGTLTTGYSGLQAMLVGSF
jgi:hypothetical protein